MKPWIVFSLFFLITLSRSLFSFEPSGVMNVGNVPYQIILAQTEHERMRGLMGQTYLAPRRGMLFVFEKDQQLSFWMKDTPLPLSIAYIDSEGVIQEIHSLEPYDLRVVFSKKPLRYALEVNQGEFHRLGISPGDQIDLKVLHSWLSKRSLRE